MDYFGFLRYPTGNVLAGPSTVRRVKLKVGKKFKRFFVSHIYQLARIVPFSSEY